MYQFYNSQFFISPNMKHSIPFILFFILAGLFACKKEEQETLRMDKKSLTDELAIFYYQQKLKNNTILYVDHMHSCDSTSQEYKNRIADMLKHHKKHILSYKKGVDSVRVSHKQFNAQENMAYVYFNVFYKDHSTEEVLLPLVFKDNEWRIQ